jgi:hypothetical protein
MIGARNGNVYSAGQGILFRNPSHYETILTWCRRHTELAPERIAHMMPLSITEGDEVKWHPFAKAIIDEFGDNERLLSQLSSNMGTYGTVGSSVPYFLNQKKLIEELLTHPIERVREWAIGMLDYTEKTIKIEQLGDEERFMN